MTAPTPADQAVSPLRAAAKALFQRLASVQLAVLLLVILAAVLALATVLDAAKGADYAQWYVYHSAWFIAILGLLGANILAAALIRFPWGKRHIGFLITHGGLLVVLAGSIQTFVAGVTGQLSFLEGETVGSMLLTDRSQFEVQWQGGREARGQPSVSFGFTPGPSDWPEGETLNFGELGGIGLKVLKLYRHARVDEDWIGDEGGLGGPALKFALAGPDGQTVREEWLTSGSFGGELPIGPIALRLYRTPVASMLDDFLKPPAGSEDKDGILSVHHEGRVERVPVGKNVGKKLPVGQSKISVEIVEYLANAKPAARGRFVSQGNEPANPLLELRLHLPDKEPLRQIAFAKMPFLSLDGLHGQSYPVKFWYHHPAAAAPAGVEFLATPDDKLYCRVGADGKYQPRGEVKPGDRIEVAAQFAVLPVEYLPHARRKITFQPVELVRGRPGGQDAAALVEVKAAGTTHEVWMKRNDPEYGSRTIQTPRGPLAISFGFERVPLGFSLKLLDFKRGLNPGGMGEASFASSVRLIDPARGIDEEREIAMNEPLVHGGYTFYQSSYEGFPDGREASVLSVAYDPGRFSKYAGSLVLCLGIFVTSFLRLRGRKNGSAEPAWQAAATAGSPAGKDGQPGSPPSAKAAKSQRQSQRETTLSEAG